MARKKKHYKEDQIFDDKLMFSENPHIRKCYDHFKLRWRERYGKTESSALCYESYWLIWIKELRGRLAYITGDTMVRVIGNYMKDPVLYKVVYVRMNLLNIYVPLTIIEISDHKKKHRLYRHILNNKNIVDDKDL